MNEHPDPAVEYLNSQTERSDPFREGYSGTGDEILHFVESGEGPLIVFVHGFPSFWFGWFKQLEALRDRCRVIAVDAPGANLSRRPDGWDGYSVERLANRLGSFIEEVSDGEAITLVGHDWGGSLVWAYAEYDASLLDRLVVLSAPPFSLFIELASAVEEQQKRTDYMPRIIAMDRVELARQHFNAHLHARSYATLEDRGILSPAESDLFKSALTLDAVNNGIEWYRRNMPPFDTIDVSRDAWPSAHAYADVDTLLIEGELDKTFVDDLAQRAQSHARSLTSVRLPGIGHWTPLEAADAVTGHIARFIGVDEGD